MDAAIFLEFTPPRAQKNDMNHREDDEPIVLILAPFNPAAKIFFEDTKINEIRTKPVIVRNPTSTPINVILDRLPEPESCLSLSEVEFTVAAASQHKLLVTWEAVKALSLHHVIHVKNRKNNKKLSEIIVTATRPAVPVKKKSHCALRAKVLSKSAIVFPKVRVKRMPLKKKTPPNSENTFIVPGKDFELQHADLPTSPRRQTYTAENKENTPGSGKRKRSTVGFRLTTMEPPPSFTAHRKRKQVPQAEASLEIKECFSEDEPARPIRRSTYSLNSPGSNSLSAIAQGEPLVDKHAEKQGPQSPATNFSWSNLIDGSCGSDDVFVVHDSRDSYLRTTENRSPLKNMLQTSTSHNHSAKHNRLSVDSLNGLDVSSGSSDVVSIARDSLDGDFQTRKSHSPLKTMLPAPSNFDRDSYKSTCASTQFASEILDENSYNAKVRVQLANLFEEPSHMSLQKTWEKKVHYDSRVLSPIASTSNDANSPIWHTAEQLSPIRFSPSFNPKRCTFIKDPATPGLGASINNISYTIIDENEENTFCDVKLNTPQIETPCEKKRLAMAKSTLFTSPNIEETDGQELDDLRLRTPQVMTPCMEEKVKSQKPKCQFSSPDFVDLSTGKSPWKFSPLQSITENLVLKTPIVHTPRLKILKNSTQMLVCERAQDCKSKECLTLEESSKSAEENSKFAQRLLFEIKKSPAEELAFKVENFTSSTPEDSEITLLPENSSIKTEVSVHDREKSVYSATCSDKPLVAPYEVAPFPELGSGDIQIRHVNPWSCRVPEHVNLNTGLEEVPTLENEQRESAVLLEISPPKINRLKKAGPSAKPSRVLANSIIAKSVISPTRRVKRLAAAHKSATPHAMTAKYTAVVEVKRTARIHCAGPMCSSEKINPPRKRYTGVPMSTLKLRPMKKSSMNVEKCENIKNSASHFKSNLEKEAFSPDHYIRSLSQPADYMFFFSKTSKTDPFISSSLYYDPEWLDRQEKDLINWLNSLLTPPADLEADSAGHWRVDVAALWKKSQTSKIDLAPSKEVVSSRYLTHSRLNMVRKAAGTLFRGEMAPVFSKLAVSINKKLISVRDDRDLHLDYGLQCKVLSLLLCYNPLWLRIGLETIYGRPIMLHSNSDVVGLTTFIRRYLLSDAYLKKKHSHPKVPSLYLPSFGDEMKKFILRKFFMLVYFLDQAKTRKLIGHDPCLFVTSSPFKSSRDLVIEFAKDLIAGLGDITKYLRSFGYVLKHKQTYLDEFNYAVICRQDLRDGVRLTRVMEIILSIHTLSSKLRTPAISRLQKVHNVDVALKALQEAGYVIQGEINSKDIVDGHREKTLSLLWQIIYKFQAPRYEKAALKLQTWWRKNSLRFEIQKRICIKRLAKQNEAATRIQALWRGFISRKKMIVLKEQLLTEREARIKAAIMIQKQWRRFVARKHFKAQRAAVMKIQRWCRRKKSSQQRQEFVKLRHAVILVQQRYRANKLALLEQEKYAVLRNAAIKLQRYFRHNQEAKTCRQRYLALRIATIFIQRRFRAKKQVKLQREAFMTLRRYVIFVQQHYRAKLISRKCYCEYIALKRVTCFIQETFRKNQAMRVCRDKYLAQHQAVIVIQRWFRMKMVRKNFLALKSTAMIIQVRFRAWQAMKADRQVFIEQRHAAIVLQTCFRASRLAKEKRTKFLQLKNAAVCVQQRYRAKRAAQTDRAQFKAIKSAAILVQCQWRARKAAKTQRQEYLKLKAASIALQTRFRANRARSKYLALKSAVTTIQTRWRANVLRQHAREDFVALRQAAVFVQQMYRANKAMNACRREFLQLKTAVVFIQRKVRAKKAMIMYHKKYQQLLAATQTIQTRFRANLFAKEIRQKFLAQKSAAIIIQRQFRAEKAMVVCRMEYQQLKSAAIFVQKKFRAKKAMEKYRGGYQQLLAATRTIQTRFRANLRAKEMRQNFLTLKSAAIIIQRQFRAQKAMVVCRTEYQQLKSTAIFVQRKFRAKKAMEKNRGEYQQLLVATRTIQTRFRANLLAKEMRQKFLAQKSAAIIIQRQFRAQKAMVVCRTEYQQLKSTAIFVQRKFRAKKAMEKYRGGYQQLLAATRTIQTRFRANLRAKEMRQNFLTLKSAAIIIQRQFRAQKAMVVCRTEYQQLKSTAIFVQRKFRAKKAMEKNRGEYQQLLVVTRTIQTRFRANLLAKEMRQKFLAQKSAATIIQRQFRAQKAMMLCKTEYQQLKSAAICVQRKLRAKKAMKKCHGEYQQLLVAARAIQTRFRANLHAKEMRQNFLTLKSAAIIIQRQFRAQKAMVVCRTEYQQLKSTAIFVQRKFRAKKAMEKNRGEYQQLLVAARTIQSRFRANLRAKEMRQNFLTLKSAVIIIQRQFRAQKAMVVCRMEYQQLKSAAIFVQRKFRAKKAMEKYRGEYQQLLVTTRIIQTRFRAYLLGKEMRQKFLAQKSAATVIQRHFRARKAMVACRTKFHRLKSATIFVQQKFRAIKTMEKCRSDYEHLREAAIYIQQKFRATLAAQEARRKFLVQCSAAVVIQRWFRERTRAAREEAFSRAAVVLQRWWRAVQQGQAQQKEFNRVRRTVVWVQQKWRGKKLVRSQMEQYRVMIAEKEQILAKRREQEQLETAAIKIQALWRGHHSRKTVKLPNSSKQAVRQLVNVVELPSQRGQTLQNRYDFAMEQILSQNSDLQSLISAFMNLDTITYLSSKLCDELVDGELVKIVYFQLQTANRSVPYQELCIAGLRILINLARYNNTDPILWQETLDCNGISILLGFVRAYCDKNDELFCAAVTLLWLFSDDPNKSKVILNNEMCRKILTFVWDRLQKKNMKPEPKGKARKALEKVTPSKVADWGLRNKSKVFENPLYSTTTLCQKLQIPLKFGKLK